MSIRPKITAIIPTLNEEENIVGAIDSLNFVDEIIVLDSFSTDQTTALCKKENVKFIQRRFDDFSSQKNYAIDQAQHDWIFILDADERIPENLAQEINQVLTVPHNFVGYSIYRTFYYRDERVKFGGWQTDKVVRLFKKKYCRYDGKLVHEKLSCNGKVGRLVNRMNHYSFKGPEQYRKKLNFYAALQAKEILRSGKNVHPILRMVKPGFRFIVLFFVRLGFLDGAKDLNLARMHAFAVKNRYQQYDVLLKQA